jgi:hypothetical protein
VCRNRTCPNAARKKALVQPLEQTASQRLNVPPGHPAVGQVSLVQDRLRLTCQKVLFSGAQHKKAPVLTSAVFFALTVTTSASERNSIVMSSTVRPRHASSLSRIS